MRRSDEVAAEGSGSKHGRTDSRGQGAEKTGRGALSRGAGAVKHAASATVGGVKHVAGEAATHTAGAVMLENQSRERPGATVGTRPRNVCLRRSALVQPTGHDATRRGRSPSGFGNSAVATRLRIHVTQETML